MPASVTATCTAVSGWAMTSTPMTTSATARAARRHFDLGFGRRDPPDAQQLALDGDWAHERRSRGS